MATGYRVRMTAAQRAEWQRRWSAVGTPAREMERLDILRLSAFRDRSVPQIAEVMRLHEQTVRRVVTRFLADGFAGLADRPRTGRPPTLTEVALVAVEVLLDGAATSGQTWTTPRLATWLAEMWEVRVNAEYLGSRLRARKFRWKRTKRSVRHKQTDPDLQARKKAALEVLTF